MHLWNTLDVYTQAWIIATVETEETLEQAVLAAHREDDKE